MVSSDFSNAQEQVLSPASINQSRQPVTRDRREGRQKTGQCSGEQQTALLSLMEEVDQHPYHGACH